MAFTYPITIIDSQIYINGNLYSGEAGSSVTQRMKTHDLSDQIAPGIVDYVMNPSPVLETLIVVLDGLVLAKDKDYFVTNNEITLTATPTLPDPATPNTGSVLLAIYEEA
jgi:hypothetical protein